ncbi:hypothetical protein SSP24_05450 [Streptomyces spinoverrucosus]|uniref:Uncharacterized protein n=1 Tax=Streptomyces spinoverrucosus TaxID=284043 RepID=A0A4Y3VAQ2_9ACTN|nr:hypothetical protein SSP24_05450 [Streptomyces spinoverrucosus]GHB39789.1 hypothetical protein GCM10010397_07140 [Streptomyces spinoverrucosus]
MWGGVADCGLGRVGGRGAVIRVPWAGAGAGVCRVGRGADCGHGRVIRVSWAGAVRAVCGRVPIAGAAGDPGVLGGRGCGACGEGADSGRGRVGGSGAVVRVSRRARVRGVCEIAD